MLWRIAEFEIRKARRRLSTWIYFAIYFAIAMLLVIAAGGGIKSSAVQVGMGGGKTLVNSPVVLCSLISLISYFGVVVIGALSGQAVYQDFHWRTYPLFFTAPIRRWQYLGGRFLGSFLVLAGILSSIGLGCWMGTLWPTVDPALFGPNMAAAYLQPYLIIVLPNLLLVGSVFFALAALVRKMMPVYVASVLLLVGYMIAAVLASDVEHQQVAAMVDPFGMYALEYVTQYWTVAERNSQLLPLAGLLLGNRLLWLAVGGLALGLALVRFRFAQGDEGGTRSSVEAEPALAATSVMVPATCPRRPSAIRLLPRLTWLAFRETVKNVYFPVIVLAGVLFMVFAAQMVESIYGTRVYPVTATMVRQAGGSFSMFMIILLTFYAGELVWRERDAGVDPWFDVLPIPTWLPLVAKLFALVLLQAVLLAMVMLSAMAIQAFQGYFRFEPGLYLADLFGLQLPHYCLLCVLAIAVQVVVNHKYVGHFVMVLYYLATLFMGRFGFEHNLYQYASTPGYLYSDMNGFGHFLRAVGWFDAYWAVCALLLAVAANLLWVRGREVSLRQRLKFAGARLSAPLVRLALASAASMAAIGGFIFYNTNVLNEYKTRYHEECESADYEHLYKRYERAVQPRITAIQVSVDVFPAARSMRAKGSYRLVNKSAEPVDTVFVNVQPELTLHAIAIGKMPAPTRSDRRLGFHTFELERPLPPGGETSLGFDVELAPRGFRNDRPDMESVYYNGTFFTNGILPRLGYQSEGELNDNDTRRRHGLAVKEGQADAKDAWQRGRNFVTPDSDWVTFDTTVSTDADQIAIMSGDLERQWEEGGRRWFHYTSAGKNLALFPVLSARYAVRHDRWKDVAIEIYYHPGHEYNLDSMIDSVKASLDYFTTHFSPYQHHQVRIVEFPRYARFAASLSSTIPYSESIGFIARVNPNDPEDVNYPFYVTAHEVAHQWWAHQLIGGNVQGSTMLSESLAQYSALMVMKKRFGPEQMRKFLRYELNGYLRGRGLEKKREMPLARVERQAYVYYQKGSLVMYALQDYLGEETLNRVLAQFIQDFGFQAPPYTTAPELVSRIRRVTPPELRYLVEDLFETITLYDNRAVSASYTETSPGQYEVHLTVAAKKFRADEQGAELEVPLDDLIDIGVLDAEGKPLCLEKHRIRGSDAEFTLRVSQIPAKAGIDPLNKLIDRRPEDNLIRVDRR